MQPAAPGQVVPAVLAVGLVGVGVPGGGIVGRAQHGSVQVAPGEPAEKGRLGVGVAVPDILIAENEIPGLDGICQAGLDGAHKELVVIQILGVVSAHDAPRR